MRRQRFATFVATLVAVIGSTSTAIGIAAADRTELLGGGAGIIVNGFGQQVCAQGGGTGFNCGAFRFAGPKPAFVAAVMPTWQAGDDGAPVTVDGQLVGMTRKGYTNYLDPIPIAGMRANIGFTLFSAILNDANAKGGPGAGFSLFAA